MHTYQNFSTTNSMAQLSRQTRTPSGVHSQTRQILQNLQHLQNSQTLTGPQTPQSKANMHRRQLQQFYLHKLFDSLSDAEFLPLIPGAPQSVYNKFSDTLSKPNHGMGIAPNTNAHKIEGLNNYKFSEIRNMRGTNDEKLPLNSYGPGGMANGQNHSQGFYSRPQPQFDNGQKHRLGNHFLQQHLFGGKRQDYTQYKQELQG